MNKERLGSRDLITIGIFGAISLVIFFVTGGLTALTIVGTVANIPSNVSLHLSPTCFWYRRLKKGTFLIMGIINALPGFMVANIIGLVGVINSIRILKKHFIKADLLYGGYLVQESAVCYDDAKLFGTVVYFWKGRLSMLHFYNKLLMPKEKTLYNLPTKKIASSRFIL